MQVEGMVQLWTKQTQGWRQIHPRPAKSRSELQINTPPKTNMSPKKGLFQ